MQKTRLCILKFGKTKQKRTKKKNKKETKQKNKTTKLYKEGNWLLYLKGQEAYWALQFLQQLFFFYNWIISS